MKNGHHHEHNLLSLSKAFVIGTLLNLVFVFFEGIAGFVSNSVGLLSDAGHNLSDTVSLLLAWLAFHLTKKGSNKRFTYGYGRSTILASLINASILLITIGIIIAESISKFSNPQQIDSETVILVATIGVVINFATAMLFIKDRKKDLNIKGAFLHMVMDAVVSIGVVVSGFIIKWTGWTVIDPIIGLAIAVIIFVSTWKLLKESLRLSLDAVPKSIDIDEIEKSILSIDGVSNIHHIHVWALGTTQNAITIHVCVYNITESERIKNDIRKLLKTNNISHATIETEPKDYVCNENNCNPKS